MVTASLHHHEQVLRVRAEHGPRRQRARRMVYDVAAPDRRGVPLRRLSRSRSQPARQCLQVRRSQRGAAGRHLGCGAAIAQHGAEFPFAQARQAFGQQRGPHASQAARAVAGHAVLGVKRRRIAGQCRLHANGQHKGQRKGQNPPDHGGHPTTPAFAFASVAGPGRISSSDR